MIEGLPSEETAMSELSDDARIWIIYSADDNAPIIVPDNIAEKPVLWMFLKKEDAEHFAFILRKLAPTWKNTELVVTDVLFHKVKEQAIKENQPIALVTPNKAMEFFKGALHIYSMKAA